MRPGLEWDPHRLTGEESYEIRVQGIQYEKNKRHQIMDMRNNSTTELQRDCKLPCDISTAGFVLYM